MIRKKKKKKLRICYNDLETRATVGLEIFMAEVIKIFP